MPATTASASASVLPSSLTPKTLSFYTPTKPSSLSFVSLNFRAKPIAVSSPFLNFRPFSSRFVASVAFPSGLGQEEEEEEEVEEGVFSDNGGAEVEPNFSPDLKLFVGNLPFSVDSAHLAGLFETAGNVEMVEVIYDKTTGKSRGFGFVTMSTIEGVEAAVQQFNGYELEGRALRVNTGPPPPRESSFPRGPRGGGGGSFDNANRVYVGNLSWGVDNSTLENLFSEQGKVVEAKVVYDRESGRSRGFGFVTYSSAEEVDSAISSLNGVELDGRSIRVSVAEARPRRQF